MVCLAHCCCFLITLMSPLDYSGDVRHHEVHLRHDGEVHVSHDAGRRSQGTCGELLPGRAQALKLS